MKKILIEIAVAFGICCVIGVVLWFTIGGNQKDYVEIEIPVTSVSENTMEKIKGFDKPRKFEFNNISYEYDSDSYVSILDNVSDAEAILGKNLVLPEACADKEILMEMDTDCSYIELTPALVSVDKVWAEIHVQIRLTNESYRFYTLYGNGEDDTYTEEECEVNGQQITLYYFADKTFAVYLNDDISYVYTIYSTDPDEVKAFLGTISIPIS
ncbi:hypothetical protein [Pseudobutyrivibrio sp.]|uniref:hypothetical protein n=1 Tax=Pseudobutyrivibrio sp. TaxID=2014367 RepID=UPI001DE53DC7|nr:hypothetical protein [Pseudobutyrivibrio sp.]MBE5910821.1 hypothetical protein [Pseudobutyrivibrio sp.]